MGAVRPIVRAVRTSVTYGYDALNRLTSLQSSCGTAAPGCVSGTQIASYAYTLGAAGNRLSVQELSGRTVQYAYDDLYRLTSETIAGATAQNGTVSYQYDAVGNRKQLASTVAAIPATGLLNYDANDRLSTQLYDNNGNTVNNGTLNVYDFENRLVRRGNVSIVYDGDVNRVSETVGGATVSYTVADVNPTGYPQVVQERQNQFGPILKNYQWGLQLIAEGDLSQSPLHCYGMDGHGSVRYLTDANGATTDTYDYDAFGNLISQTGATANNYLFAGEQFDPALGVYYNRARYFDQRLGRFWTADTFEGDPQSPASLHKYLYAGANPIDRTDPSGNDFGIGDLAVASAIGATIGAISTVTANYALGRAQTFTSIAQGAAIGAVVGPLALAFPLVGAGIGVLSISGAGVTLYKTFNNPNSTPGQKVAAFALIVAALYGTARAFQYAANPQTPTPPVVNSEVPPLVKVPGTLNLELGNADIAPKNLLLGRADIVQGKLDSINTLGPSQTDPIIVSRNGVVYNGNHRVFLAAKSGVPSIKVIVVDVNIDGGYPIDQVPIVNH
ncbi:MAG TPA: RHS repeat-associated core domain-containing protein [Candidatus Angelobacter sp.]|nr:RHS repeat-associated core domain-containing protein [Candidatus Angelobacter sp.]